MALEIERKFLVKGDGWRKAGSGVPYCQGYFAGPNKCTIRVRIAGNHGYLTIKGKTAGAVRQEYEYEIPLNEAREMLEKFCEPPLIEKTRYKIPHANLVWEVDEFAAENAGLIIAEVELSDENQEIELPEWIGKEVTGDPKYFNASLARHPYSKWKRK